MNYISDRIYMADIWDTWLALGDRGTGKTSAGALWMRDIANVAQSRIALVGTTFGHARHIMVDSILAYSLPNNRPTFDGRSTLNWPSGAVAYLFSSDEQDRIRGPQFHFAFCDDVDDWISADAWHYVKRWLWLGRAQALVTARSTESPIVGDVIRSSSLMRITSEV